MIRTPPSADRVPGRLVYRALMGSHAYGSANQHSDEDWRGVYLLPSESFLGLDRPQLTHEEKPDGTYWELGQFCRLLLKGNPNMVGMLWAPDDCVDESVSDQWPVVAPLRLERQRFVSTKAVEAYVAWAHRELKEIDSKNKNSTHRDYSKRLSHVPRLMWEIEGAVTTREVPVRLEGEHLATVMAIKSGDMPFEEAMDYCGQLVLDVDQVVERELPKMPEPPHEWTRAYLLETRELYGR